MSKCTTHHDACECRTELAKRERDTLRERMKELRDALQDCLNGLKGFRHHLTRQDSLMAFDDDVLRAATALAEDDERAKG